MAQTSERKKRREQGWALKGNNKNGRMRGGREMQKEIGRFLKETLLPMFQHTLNLIEVNKLKYSYVWQK